MWDKWKSAVWYIVLPAAVFTGILLAANAAGNAVGEAKPAVTTKQTPKAPKTSPTGKSTAVVICE